MKSFVRVLNNKNNIIINTFPPDLVYLLDNQIMKPELIDLLINGDKRKARLGRKKSHEYTLFLLTTEPKYKDLKKFKCIMDATFIMLEDIITYKKEISNKLNTETQQLIHNLTSLNTYNIQDLFSLIPQQLLSEYITEQEKNVKQILKEQPNVASKTLLKLIKNNLAMKVEFSVFNKTMENYPTTKKTKHSIRKLILSILHIFVQEFEQKKITLSLDSSEKILNIDSESLNVSIYYILENAVKYCAKNSTLKIHFKEESNCFSVIFDMISLQIKNNEINKLCELNYRSENAIRYVDKGEGIGMYRVLKTLKMNDADLEITPRFSQLTRSESGETFEHNLFKLNFPNQQSWR